jgi:hypothetical protein
MVRMMASKVWVVQGDQHALIKWYDQGLLNLISKDQQLTLKSLRFDVTVVCKQGEVCVPFEWLNQNTDAGKNDK